MATATQLSFVDRLLQLLQHLGIERTHVAGALASDWRDLAATHAHRVASLSLVCPPGFDPRAVATIGSRTLVFHGDQGAIAERVRAAVGRVPEVALVTLAGYAGLVFSDVAADRGAEIAPALLNFVQQVEQKHPTVVCRVSPGAGEVAGLSYRVHGAGPPLVLLPLTLAPSQWEPLLEHLGQSVCTITVAGPHAGIVPLLERRGTAPGYVRLVRTLVEEVGLRPGETILDMGCGSGVVTRWLARQTGGANAIVAVDINRYLLQEARALADKTGLKNVISFEEANGHALPFADNHFDAAISITVIEEGDADQMLAELVRVTKPGGRVAVMVRGEDWPTQLTLALRSEVSTKAARAMGAGAAEGGCADASLYRRFEAAGLREVRNLPQLAVYDDPEDTVVAYYQGRALSALTPAEVEEWQTAMIEARERRAFLMAVPHHCAVGTKP